MKGIRLIAAVAAVLLALAATSVALAAQDEGEGQGAASPATESESLPARTADSETLTLPSGRLETRIYPEPINYRDEEGNWRPIGGRLHETGEQTVVNGPNDFDVTLPKQIDSKPVRFEVGDQWVESQLQRKDLEGAELEGGTATYEGEGSAPSFEFTGLSNGLKEEIELSGPGQASTYTYELSASDGLKPVLNEDGSIQFRDEGKTVVVLPAPVMSDAIGAESRAVHYELGPEEEGRWKLSVIADPQWLAEPERKFPVAIDPTITTGPPYGCVIGGHKGETGWIDCASWGRKDFLIGYAPQIKSAEDNWWRTLMELETTSIPVNSEISSATFNIHSLEVAQNTKGVELRKVTKPWNWEASWSRYAGPEHLWTTEGGDYSESLGEVLTSSRGNQIGWWQFNMPAKVVEAEVNTEEWLSVIMKLLDDKVRECGSESCTERKVDFDSSAATTEANRPYLSVVYKAPAPIAATEAATAVGETGATLKGQVNPHGYATTYQFEYGTTTSYGTKVPTTAESVGSGKTNVAVSKAISGLKGNTTYHYRVSATNVYGTSPGLDKTFTTPKLPTVTTEAASGVKEKEATLKGSVNPNGNATTYQFEYGPTTSYGTKVPLSAESVGSGTTAVAVSKVITGLAEGSEYHYRVVASNAAGTAKGADKTLKTTHPPQTTITSATPSYTSHEETPIEFESSQAGSTFKCGLDEGEAPTKPCTSPYVLPEHLEEGGHTFVVAAASSEGQADTTPAKYSFDPAIYPPAPSTSKLVYPEDGKKTASYYTLEAEWGKAPEGGVTFQMKLPSVSWPTFKDVPEECMVDGEGHPVSWPLPATSNFSHTEPVFLKVRGCKAFSKAGYPEREIQFRAVFDGSKEAAGASEPASTEFVRNDNGTSVPTDTTESIGPASVDLLTGAFTVSHTDVSIPVPGSEANLEFTRVYGSDLDEAGAVIGRGWQPSVPVEREYEGSAWRSLREEVIPATKAVFDKECWNEEDETIACGEGCNPEFCEEWEAEEAHPEERWMELIGSESEGISFEISGANYVSPEYAKELVLTREDSEHIVLSTPEGTHTTFLKVGSQEYMPKTVSFQATPGSVRMVYGGRQLQRIISPTPKGVESCGDVKSIETPGCRTLVLEYDESPGPWHPLEGIRYYNASGEKETSQVIAKYAYDEEDHLIEEWDPRLPKLKERYAYGSFLMTSVTPPGEEPWEFNYEEGPPSKLKSVSRASLVEGEPTATTTIAYEVPLSGDGAPHDMSPEAVAEWGQTDFPVDATAVFPPTEVPEGKTPSDYSQATIHYMDPNGYEVNTASPSPPGVEGDSITTTETDVHGNVVRELSAQNRLKALQAENPVARSEELESGYRYSEDGTKMIESWGPLHKVRLENGETVEASTQTGVQYDQDAPELKEGESAPRLPTTEVVDAYIPSRGEAVEARTTETKYNWVLRKPTETIVDPKGLNLRTRFAYDKETGLPVERSLPAKPEGGDARTTKTVYYTAGGSNTNACEGKPAWEGLPCEVKPAAQPSAEGQPELLVTKYKSYNGLDEPTEIIESPGGKEEAGKTRTTVKTYDAAGREVSGIQEGGGLALPETRTAYSASNGRPVEQRFACKSKCWSGTMGYVSSFGTKGSGEGQFTAPVGITVDAEGNIWVADAMNSSVQEFSEAGEYRSSLGSPGKGDGQFSSPSDLATNAKGDIWVVDSSTNRVQEFSPAGEYMSKFGASGSGDGQFVEPRSIAIGPGGHIWVTDCGNNRLEEFNEAGEFIRKVGSKGSGEGQMACPFGVATGPGGNVWVADSGNDRVEEFSETGSFIRQFGKEGSGKGEFKRPVAIDVDPAGNVWVADEENYRVQEFGSGGEYIAAFGSEGNGEGQFGEFGPEGIASSEGRFWVLDPANYRVEEWAGAEAFDSQAVTTAYDRLGRPVQYTDADGNTSKTTYDLLGRPATVNDGKGTQEFGYDETSGLLIAMKDSAAGLFTAGYNADGAMTEQGLPDGLVAKTTYDEAGQPTKLTYTKVVGCSEKCTWIEESQERSIYGQVLTQKSLTSSQQYSYDKAGRLTLVHETPTGGGCTTRAYAFDADSNRTSLTTRAQGSAAPAPNRAAPNRNTNTTPPIA